MRKIEQEILNAVHRKGNLSKDNTEVVFLPAAHTGAPDGDRSEVFLHRNHIATYYHATGKLEVNAGTLRRWPTVTTKSRLRALGANITTKRGVTYLDDVAI